MKPLLTVGLLLFFVALFPNSVSAATYYLSPSGNDSNNGSSTSPWKTINKANQTASSGDTIILKNGIYQGTGQAYQALTKAGVTWQAENKHQAIIDGGFGPESLNGDWRNIVTAWNARCTSLGQWSRLMSVQSNNITIDGLFLRNSCGGGILIADDVVNATFKNSKIDWTFIAGFYAAGETTNLQVLGNEMTRISFNDEYKQYNGEGYGVNISIHMSGENMVVRDNIIAFGRGEIAMTGARNLLFENNVVVANKNNFYNGWADGVIVRNNLFWAPDANKHPGTHWDKSNKNTNDWHLSSRNEYDNRWVNYASGLNNIAYYNNLIINNSVQFNGYHNKQGVTYSTNTTNVYFGHNTLVTGPHTTSLFKLSFNAIEGATGDSKITGIVESNIFDVSKDASEAFPISLSSNDSVTFRNNIMPASAPSSMKGPGDVYRNSAGLVNALAVLDFPIPAAGAPSVNMSGLRNAVNLNNYRLNNSSSAVNAGSTAGAMGGIQIPVLARAKDYILADRVGIPDMGAFELDGIPGPTFTPGPTPTSGPTPTGDLPDDWDLDNDGDVDVFDFNRYVRKVMQNTDQWSRLTSFIAAFRLNTQ